MDQQAAFGFFLGSFDMKNVKQSQKRVKKREFDSVKNKS